MKFTPDGQVEDGLLLCGYWEGGLFSSLKVFDVFDWLKKQFIRLRVLYENAPPVSGRKPSTNRMIYLGGDEAPFCSLHANKTSFRVYFFHPEIVGMPENVGIYESADVDEVRSLIIRKASKVSTFNWVGMVPQFEARQDYDTTQRQH